MFIIWPAASERADACSSRCISLSGLAPDETEKICLLAEILGWRVQCDLALAGEGVRAGETARDGGLEAPVRLLMRQVGAIIRVETDDPAVRRQLARQGLDRLVPPVPLMALEQLLMFAG